MFLTGGSSGCRSSTNEVAVDATGFVIGAGVGLTAGTELDTLPMRLVPGLQMLAHFMADLTRLKESSKPRAN